MYNEPLGTIWDGQKIKYLRKKLEITQEELANLLETTRTQVGRWESGQCRPSKKQQIQLTMVARERNVPMALEDLDFRALLDSINDLAQEVHTYWLSRDERKKRKVSDLAVKMARVEHCRDEIDWTSYIYKLY